jgi:hypothetical protein
MSYVDVTPAYYSPLQWNQAFHVGAPGWLQANVPPWGQNPNNAWPAVQAQNGLGEAPAAACTPAPCPPPPGPPPFSWVGRVPFQWYIQQGISPWGRFPRGRAYGAPRPLACKGCIGMPVVPGVGSIVEAARAINAGDMDAAVRAVRQAPTAGLGAACGPCQITDGDRCLPCPNGSDVDECQGCVDGQPVMAKPKWYEHPLFGPIAIGVTTTVATAIALAVLKKKTHVPVG